MKNRRSWLTIIVGALAAAATAPASLAQPSAPEPAAAAPEPAASAAPASTGTLVIFNASGPTLIPGNQVVTDNGARLVSLPRRTYAQVQLAPGAHLLKPDPPLWKQQVLLQVEPGQRYYVVVAYKPERSWAAPFAGAPLILQQITEEQAAPLLAEMKPQ